MGQYVLGLDLGGYSIKASLFETTFSNYELVNLFESSPLYVEDLSEEEKDKVYVSALKKLIEGNKLLPDVIVYGLPGNIISTRILHFPISDEKKIARILPMEFESHVPFPLDTIVLDYHLVQKGKEGATVIACAVQKEQLARHLALLNSCGIDPRIVDIDSLSLYNLLNISDLDPDGTYAFIDIGHFKTSLCITKEGKAHFIRTMSTAGLAITNSIRYEFDLIYKQAERLKHKHGIIELENQSLPSSQMRKISNAIRKAIDPLIQDIIQSIHAFQAGSHSLGGEKQKIDKIFLTGGSSLLPNIGGYIQQISNIPVENFSGFSDKPELKKRLGPKESFFHQAVALGLRSALRGSRRQKLSRLNFRKDEFAVKQETEVIVKTAKKYAIWTAVLLLCFFINIGVRHHILSQRLKKTEKQIIQLFHNTVKSFPKNQKISASKAVRIMQAKLNENLKRYEVLTAGLKGVTALEILKAISEKMPKDVTVDISRLNISGGKVFLRGETNSFASVDKIVTALSSYKYFTDVQKGEVKDAPTPGKKSFSLSMRISTDDVED